MSESIQDNEQRQSSRFRRRFWVTDHEDNGFVEPFEGYDVNLTGLSFCVKEADLFFPEQPLSLRIKNLETDEVYCLEGAEVVHLYETSAGYICGCHITHVTSSQLLAHHRLVMTDENSAALSMRDSDIAEFHFVEEGSPLSRDRADYQQASMALNLAVSQLLDGKEEGLASLTELRNKISALPSVPQADEIQSLIDQLIESYRSMSETTLVLSMLARLLVHTPDREEDKQAWQTMIADFENRFLNERQQVAYDFMHQGLSAEEALIAAEQYLNEVDN